MITHPTETTFNDEESFNKELTRIFKKLINDKLPMFLDFCIQTHNAEPIKQVIYIISVNRFEV